ncbi:MAG: hypothetical protein AB3F67_2060 [Candidatus Phytoplasma solani]
MKKKKIVKCLGPVFHLSFDYAFGDNNKRPQTGLPNAITVFDNGIVDHFDANGKSFQSTLIHIPFREYVVCKYFADTGIVDTITMYGNSSYSVIKGTELKFYNYDGTINHDFKESEEDPDRHFKEKEIEVDE